MNTRKRDKGYQIAYGKIWRMLWPSIRKQSGLFPLLFFGALLLAVLTVVEPYLYGNIVDLIIVSVSEGVDVHAAFESIAPFLFIWIGVVILSSLTHVSHTYATWWAANKTLGFFLGSLFKRTLRLDVRRFEDERSGELIRRFDSSWDGIFNLFSIVVLQILVGVLTFLLAVVVGLFIDWRMMIVSLLPIPLIVLIGYINYRFARTGQDKVNKAYEKMSGHVGDAFVNIATVKSFTREKQSVSQLERRYWKTNIIQNRVNYIWSAASAGYGAVYTGGRLFVFAAGTWFVIQGSISLGTMIMFLGFTGFLFGSVQQVVTTLPQMLRYLSQLDRTEKVWSREPRIKETEQPVKLKKVHGDVSFYDVSFSYGEGTRVLKGVSLEIPAGETFALVGESGAGKSTLAKLLLRFEDPTKGFITIDGVDLKEASLKSLRRNVGLVMQENLLFHDTVLNNIKLAKPSASKKEIEAAARRAQAHDFISKLPNGYKSMVGERGVKLSGGEKQRIALARVFLEDPPILVLDEATSALDSKTEQDLQIALKEVMKNRTTLVIAHRLSTVMSADNILVMDKGRIVDQGKHEDLIKGDTLYRRYWEIQAGGYV